MRKINREKVKQLIKREQERYISEHPKSLALLKRAQQFYISGVPMHWMADAPAALPPFVIEAQGSRITDVDGHTYLDMCMGGSAAISGHSPEPVVTAITRQATKGLTTILPTEEAIWVGEELSHRFGLPYWQIYTTATDANRYAIKVARHVTKRPLVLVFDGCYHGSVDESLVSVESGSQKAMGHDVIGALPNVASRVVHFNDLDALEKALSTKDVACVLTEPALTNTGIIFPVRGFHEALREITQHFGTLLVIDETHTITAGPGGLIREWNLKPDIYTMGKPIAGGLPAAIMGITREVAKRLNVGANFPVGMGNTLSGNPLQIAAIKANLEYVLNEANYERMIGIANIIGDSIDAKIAEFELPWHLARIGCRLELCYSPNLFRNYAEFEAAYDEEMDCLRRLYFANRGVWVTPVHSTVLVSAAHTSDDASFFTRIFDEFVSDILAGS
jgi:glutamate-1-semialdehyde 2,1-aminomutase